MPTTSRTTKIVAWTPAILVCVFLILASAAPKLFLAYPGSPLEAFAKELGIWDIQFLVGIVELTAAVLFLIPRTATVGFILLVGLLGGALATILTHTSQTAMPGFPVGMLALLMLSAYFRCPELLLRARNKIHKTKQHIAAKITAWVTTGLLVFMFGATAVLKFVPISPGSEGEAMMQKIGTVGMEHPLGILQFIILMLYVIPRTSVIGFVLMVGYLGGAWATNLTHGMGEATVVFCVLFAVLALNGWFRTPELTDRIRNKLARA